MKRNTVKRLLGLLLSMIMLFGLIAACASDDSPAPTDAPPAEDPAPPADDTPAEDPAPPAESDEKVTITVMQWALDNQTTDFENLWYYKQIEEMTGVSVNWRVVKESDWLEQMNLMFSSGDWPDVIVRPDQSLNIEEYGVLQGILLPLDELIAEHMPNYAERLTYNGFDGADSPLRASDGRMYHLGFLIAQNINHNAHFFINQTWLDAVGMDTPTTVDELTDVLRAFRDEQPGTGANTYPMSAGGTLIHQTNGIYPYFGMFGVPLQRWVYANIDDSGTVVFPGYADGFREACEWLALCYAEGLLDPEAITQEENEWNARVNDDEVGFAVYLRLINSAWTNPDTTQNWASILPPSTSRGATVPRELEIPEFGAVITAANNHVPETLRWLDAQYDPEWMMIASNGPTVLDDDLRATLGEDWELEEAPLLMENGFFRAPVVPANNALYKIVPVTQGQFFAPGDWYFNSFELPPHRIERRDYSAEYEAAGVVEQNSYMILTRVLKPTPDDASELERLFTDIETMMRERISNFILNGVTDESWEAFLSEAENVGVGRYLEIYQKYYDAQLG